METIDFVITWVDGNDPAWRAEKNRAKGIEEGDAQESRYRDWETLRYWFRGVEKFAPWVHKVYFVTWGHYPEWLNINNPKLKIVRHEDYIPAEYLPTFSSRTIDMNFHHIKELSQHFVYFNDDMYLVKEVKERDFFRNGLPCETAILDARCLPGKNKDGKPVKQNGLYTAAFFDMAIVNRYFNKSESIRKNFLKWFNPVYGVKGLRTWLLMPWELFTGFKSAHVPYSYLKSSYEQVWEKEFDILDKTSRHKFRETADVNHWIFNYWQMASGAFSPRSPKAGLFTYMSNNQTHNQKVKREILSGKYKFVCVNDEVTDPEAFDEAKQQLTGALETILPEKSSFELY